MRRRKRVRKERVQLRRARRDAIMVRLAAIFLADQRERSELRAAIDKMDLPNGVKMFVGLLVDPCGAACDLAVAELNRTSDVQRG